MTTMLPSGRLTWVALWHARRAMVSVADSGVGEACRHRVRQWWRIHRALIFACYP